MNTDEDLCSSIVAWLPAFQTETVETALISLSDAFIEYLKQDGIRLPPSLRQPAAAASPADDSWDEEETWVGDEFTDLQQELQSLLKRFGGRVFLKTNWSAPRDASYMTVDNTLCARSVADIFLLLKGSDRVAHDLLEAPQLTLAVRRWVAITPSSEFRCFVRYRCLVGILPFLLDHYAYLTSVAGPQASANVTFRITTGSFMMPCRALWHKSKTFSSSTFKNAIRSATTASMCF